MQSTGDIEILQHILDSKERHATTVVPRPARIAEYDALACFPASNSWLSVYNPICRPVRP